MRPSEPLALVVDDDEAVGDTIAEGLRAAGWRVAVVLDAASARKMSAESPVDVVVVDAVLRGECGWDLARLFRDRGTPVLMISGHPDEIRRAPRDEFPFLSKPFSLRVLALRLIALVEEGSAARAS